MSKLDVVSPRDWYLAGGTALTLLLGHRPSVDLDFFTLRKKFNEDELERDLFATGKWETTLRERGTLYGKLLGAKMSFIAYPFFKPQKHRFNIERVRLLGPQDIAAMKIIAISQRGRKRDFVDLYYYCTVLEPLPAVVSRALRQYPGKDHNIPHIIKSLAYFDDAEGDPMPPLFFKASWDDIKKYFKQEVKKLAQDMLLL